MKYAILFTDRLLRKGRMDNCEPFLYETIDEAIRFIESDRDGRMRSEQKPVYIADYTIVGYDKKWRGIEFNYRNGSI
jgi:hypothetical protein